MMGNGVAVMLCSRLRRRVVWNCGWCGAKAWVWERAERSLGRQMVRNEPLTHACLGGAFRGRSIAVAHILALARSVRLLRTTRCNLVVKRQNGSRSDP